MKQFLLFAFFGMAIFSAWSQTTVSGTVKDENGLPVSFATVVFTNSSEGTMTDDDGHFFLKSKNNHQSLTISFVGFETLKIQLQQVENNNIEAILKEEASSLSEVRIFMGKTSKKNNPAIDILKKVWENKRQNGVRKFKQYSYRKYEKLEFDLNTIDSAFMESPLFNGMEFVFEDLDTNKITGKTYLPVFLNEAVSNVYGDNKSGKKKEKLLGNKNSGFSNNQTLIAAVKDIYREVDIYDNYLVFFDKNFVSPLSTTGVNNYNYVLADSAYVDNKWCYNIYYYPRRKNELTFKGDFWVNDTTWAVKQINLEMDASANINWVKGVYIEQDFDVLNDSVFLLTRDFFMADFSLSEKEAARGIYGKRTLLYDNFEFDKPQPKGFFRENELYYDEKIYNQDEDFWKQNRLEALNGDELGVYKMLDTLQTVSAFKRLYNTTTILASGYVEFKGWDYGPIYSTVGFNEVEGLRLRGGGRTYFSPHDPWRIEGYGAYGFKDNKFKYGIMGKVMLDRKSRLIISAGNRRDVEQLGASLTNSTDILGRSLASSSLVNVGDNDKLSSINLSLIAAEMEIFKNLNVRLAASYRQLKPASPTFSLDYYIDDTYTETASVINQSEISTMFTYTPGRITTGFGVDRTVINAEDFSTFFINYSQGIPNLFNSDFQYSKIQFFYNKPIMIGGFGKAIATLEAGKTFGQVPLALLSVVPGNQTYFRLYNSFSLLNFYEFVTDTYTAAHFEHNFNGRLFSRIPGVRKLNLRELVGIRAVWGEISEENRRIDASGLPLLAPADEPYWEYSVGVGNIFKFLRIDAHFRGNYFDNPDARTFGVTAAFGFHF